MVLRVDQSVVRTALAVDQAVVLATPVDTGRARANWQAQIGSPARDVLDGEDKGGNATLARNANIIRARRGGGTIYISNNVAYIGVLNEGSSSQAPAGFVEMAVNAGINAIRRQRVIR